MRAISWNARLVIVAVIVAIMIIASVSAVAILMGAGATNSKVLRSEDLNKNKSEWKDNWTQVSVITTESSGMTTNSGYSEMTNSDMKYINGTCDLWLTVGLFQYNSNNDAYNAWTYFSQYSKQQNLTDQDKALGITAIALFNTSELKNDTHQVIQFVKGNYACLINMDGEGIPYYETEFIYAVAHLQAGKV